MEMKVVENIGTSVSSAVTVGTEAKGDTGQTLRRAISRSVDSSSLSPGAELRVTEEAFSFGS